MFDYTGIQVDTNNTGSAFDWTSCTNDPWYYYTLSNKEEALNTCGEMGNHRAAEGRSGYALPEEANLDNELD